jgi:hypothetical protein
MVVGDTATADVVVRFLRILLALAVMKFSILLITNWSHRSLLS